MTVTEKVVWDSETEYFLSIVSFGVGLGNLWRFPYLCFKHGGASFLIPYWICMLVSGIPLVMMECLLGQFSGLDCYEVWSIAPAFKGLGWAILSMLIYLCIYYNIIISYSIIYLWNSVVACFRGVLPFSDDSDFCQDYSRKINGTNITASCQEQYYMTEVLGDTGSFTDGLLDVQLPVLLALVIAWILIALTQVWGTKSTGKTAWVTALLPYVCLTVLLISVCQLEGASIGMRYYLNPDMSKFFTTEIWLDSMTQVFFSQGVAWGILIAFARHNHYKTNVYSHAWRLSLLNALTSLYAGFTIFGTIGFLAYKKFADPKSSEEEQYKAVADNFKNVVGEGQKLVFIIYPTALQAMNRVVGLVCSLMFFLMVVCVGVGSQMTMFKGALDVLLEQVSVFKGTQKRRTIGLVWICFMMFVAAYPITTGAGLQWLKLYDTYSTLVSIQVLAFMEIYIISYVYGVDKFATECENMLGFKLPLRPYWMAMWHYVTPICMFLSILSSLYQSLWVKKGTMLDELPVWANVIGWLMPIQQILCIVIYYLRSDKSTVPDPMYYENSITAQLNESSCDFALEEKKLMK